MGGTVTCAREWRKTITGDVVSEVGGGGIGPERLQRRLAVHPRQLDVEEDQVHRLLTQGAQAVFGALCLHDVEPVEVQQVAHEPPAPRIVLYDDHPAPIAGAAAIRAEARARGVGAMTAPAASSARRSMSNR